MDSRQELCLQITASSELTGPGKETRWPWLAWAPSQGPYSAGAKLGLPPQASAAQPMLGWQTSSLLLLLNHGNKQAGPGRNK